MEEGNYRIYSYPLFDYVKDKLFANTLFLDYTVPDGSTYAYYDGEQHYTSAKSIQSTSITLTSDCVHTLAALEELGVLTDRQRMVTQEEYELHLEDKFLEDSERVYHQ